MARIAADDPAYPAYLEVGTEVSAKYRGAFCEAKVRKVVKQVKAKVSTARRKGVEGGVWQVGSPGRQMRVYVRVTQPWVGEEIVRDMVRRVVFCQGLSAMGCNRFI